MRPRCLDVVSVPFREMFRVLQMVDFPALPRSTLRKWDMSRLLNQTRHPVTIDSCYHESDWGAFAKVLSAEINKG